MCHGDSFYPLLLFLLHLYSFKQGEKLSREGINKLLQLLLTSHKTLACTHDIIQQICDIISNVMKHDVFMYASLQCELQDTCDYSLGQIDFAVFLTYVFKSGVHRPHTVAFVQEVGMMCMRVCLPLRLLKTIHMK